MKLEKSVAPETGLLSQAYATDWAAHGIDFYDGVAYGTGSGHDLLLDLMIPQGVPAAPRPVLVWIHGGGWTAAELTRKYRPTETLIRFCRAGFVCASIDYRLATEAPFPAPIEDCKCAVRFLKAHGQQLGIDPDRIGVWGESAGGQLAALVGASYNNPRLEGNGGWSQYSSAVHAVCDWYCGGDMTHLGASQTAEVQARAREMGIQLSAMRGKGEPPVVPVEFSTQILGKPGDQAVELSMDISPIFYVEEERLPPYLLMHGDSDRIVPVEFSYNFYDALLSHGHDATFVIIPRQGHGFFKGEGYYDIIAAFFQKHLQGIR